MCRGLADQQYEGTCTDAGQMCNKGSRGITLLVWKAYPRPLFLFCFFLAKQRLPGERSGALTHCMPPPRQFADGRRAVRSFVGWRFNLFGGNQRGLPEVWCLHSKRSRQQKTTAGSAGKAPQGNSACSSRRQRRHHRPAAVAAARRQAERKEGWTLPGAP